MSYQQHRPCAAKTIRARRFLELLAEREGGKEGGRERERVIEREREREREKVGGGTGVDEERVGGLLGGLVRANAAAVEAAE